MKIDSDLTFKKSIMGIQAPQNIIDDLTIINVEYIGFDQQGHKGQLIVHKNLANEIVDIFKKLKDIDFPIEKVIPIVKYDWDDNKSMSDNNSSAFNYRKVLNKDELSNHSFGRAIDLNPFQNPYIGKDGKVVPQGANYDPTVKGTIVDGDKVVDIFLKYGWEWGGHWGKTRGYLDYQHFQKEA